jgi:hypothetical protein
MRDSTVFVLTHHAHPSAWVTGEDPFVAHDFESTTAETYAEPGR